MARNNSTQSTPTNSSQSNGGEPVPTVNRKRITADDLREAATAAAAASQVLAQALEEGGIDEALIGRDFQEPAPPPQSQQGHGGRIAFEQFMAHLTGVLRRYGDKIQVSDNARWVKIESIKNGHKVYVAKGKTQVNRIESTLTPDMVPGSTAPDRVNGRIASYIPADPKSVAEAIRHLAVDEEQIRPPQRGGGQPTNQGR